MESKRYYGFVYLTYDTHWVSEFIEISNGKMHLIDVKVGEGYSGRVKYLIKSAKEFGVEVTIIKCDTIVILGPLVNQLIANEPITVEGAHIVQDSYIKVLSQHDGRDRNYLEKRVKALEAILKVFGIRDDYFTEDEALDFVDEYMVDPEDFKETRASEFVIDKDIPIEWVKEALCG